MRKYCDKIAENQSFDKLNSDCGSSLVWILALMFLWALFSIMQNGGH